MKQIVLKTSLLMTLSSLLVACSAGNRADQAQPVQLPQIVIPPQKTSLANKQ
ncbi:TPA: hypothetical protein QB455_002134 [Pasteurella multocida]|nr:hypothetical protein [Pasteurella multocida]HDR1510461.1 hypothetical protein [Pasteurella multocida]